MEENSLVRSLGNDEVSVEDGRVGLVGHTKGDARDWVLFEFSQIMENSFDNSNRKHLLGGGFGIKKKLRYIL